MSNERLGRNLRILERVAQVILVMLILDSVGLAVLLYAQGWLQYVFMRSLILLLLLEGCIIGAAGGIMYIGFGSIWGVRRETHDVASTQEQLEKQKEKHASKHQWSVALITAGLLMMLIGFMTSAITQI